MKQKSRSKANPKKAKTVLRLPDLEYAKAAVLNSLTSPDAQRGYRLGLTSSLTGVVQNPVMDSTGSWFSDTGPPLKPGNLLQALSTCG